MSAARFPRQPDLFAPPPPAGLASAPEQITPAEEARLIALIDAAPLAPFRFQGWTGKRLTHSYGWRYDFADASFGPTEPMPPALLPIRDRAAAFAGLDPAALVQALLIRYDPGAGIGWHRDRPVFEHVVGLSLGTDATMRFRRPTAAGFDRFALALAPRAFYHLCGEVRHEWQHSIPDGVERRWSITFRSLAARRRHGD